MGALEALVNVDALAGAEPEAGGAAGVGRAGADRGRGGAVQRGQCAREATPDVDTLQRRLAVVQSLRTLVNVCGSGGTVSQDSAKMISRTSQILSNFPIIETLVLVTTRTKTLKHTRTCAHVIKS